MLLKRIISHYPVYSADSQPVGASWTVRCCEEAVPNSTLLHPHISIPVPVQALALTQNSSLKVIFQWKQFSGPICLQLYGLQSWCKVSSRKRGQQHHSLRLFLICFRSLSNTDNWANTTKARYSPEAWGKSSEWPRAVLTEPDCPTKEQ